MQFLECIEKSLGFQLTTSTLNNIELTHTMLSRLSANLNEYYSTYEYPSKEDNTVRPFLSPYYEIGDQIQWYVKKHFDESLNFKFESAGELPLTNICKRHLLYSHSISFEDPLIYLTDYFANSPSKESLLRIPAIKFLLHEYAQMRPLLERNYIVPFCYNRVDIVDDSKYLLGEKEIDQLKQSTSLTSDEISLLSFPILKDLDVMSQLNHNIDLYLPSKKSMQLYAAVLKYTQQSFTSKNVIQPFLSSEIGQINGIRINAVSVDDLKNLRENEESFQIWRDFTHEILIELYKADTLYSDKGKEFLDIAKEKFKEVDSNIKAKLNKSPVLKELTNTLEQSVIGVAVGAAAGMMSGSPAYNSMITGGLAPFVKFVISCFKNVYPLSKNISFNNHFLAYDLK